MLEEDPDLLAIIVGGSIAKGVERDESDVDVIVVLKDDQYLKRLSENRVALIWHDVCDYPGGYVEGRYISRSFIKEAAERGSEPTRSSFTGSYPVYCVDSDIAQWLPLIVHYPDERQKENIASFLAQMQFNRWFFWTDGKSRGDRYVQLRAATEIVLFGCRLILAYNRILFARQKQLIEQTLAAPLKPDGLEEKINRFLTELTDEAKEDFCKAVEDFGGWGKTEFTEHLSHFLQDVELSWYNRVHATSEW